VHTCENYHPTVLLDEAVDYLVTDKNGIYCDVTCGGGGHSYELLKRHSNIKVISSDWDLNAIKCTEERLSEFNERSIVVYGGFANINKILKIAGFSNVNGFLADFGTSRYQIENLDGFSFAKNSPLDMRMSKGCSKITAEKILSRASEDEIAHILYLYGEEIAARRIARAVVEARKIRPIKTTFDLVSIVEKSIGSVVKKSCYKRGMHLATKTFQALRIAVNSELEQIKGFLNNCKNFLVPGGRIACVSFHSLEDRIVKESLKFDISFNDVAGGIITPTSEEVKINYSSRSAKMRVFEKKG
jgi:16S rRNA (cytosine1402-N4)-methyltransferase